ncbi:MAG: ABC transporter ATP-binding protein [Deltaproteobacteria bacterium]|nr:ABC transporter ATP-binding protein [Deltaproteobacteria bacterium]
MIELKNIHKSFGANKVLNGLNLTIPDGKITVILGRSGEGKSVLLKHIIGLLRPDKGHVVIYGTDLARLDDYALKEFRKKFGMLFQNAALFDSLNVFDNVAFPLREHTQMTAHQVHNRVHEVLSLVGLKNIDDKMPSELSGGMRKRVGLARAIALLPQILLYDEPTTGLDPIMTDAIDQLIINTQKQLGITSVVISHDIEASFRIADKIAMIHEGVILVEGTKEAFEKSKHPFVKQFLEGKATGEEM